MNEYYTIFSVKDENGCSVAVEGNGGGILYGLSILLVSIADKNEAGLKLIQEAYKCVLEYMMQKETDGT